MGSTTRSQSRPPAEAAPPAAPRRRPTVPRSPLPMGRRKGGSPSSPGRNRPVRAASKSPFGTRWSRPIAAKRFCTTLPASDPTASRTVGTRTRASSGTRTCWFSPTDWKLCSTASKRCQANHPELKAKEQHAPSRQREGVFLGGADRPSRRYLRHSDRGRTTARKKSREAGQSTRGVNDRPGYRQKPSNAWKSPLPEGRGWRNAGLRFLCCQEAGYGPHDDAGAAATAS